MKTNMSFIGGGNMASALIAGIQRAGMLQHLHVVDLNQAALESMAQQFGASTASAIDAQVAAQEIIVLAVKPQNMREVAMTLAPLLSQVTHQPLIISIAAGIRGTDLVRWLGGYAKLVRCMPNTPALIGKGITGMVAWPEVSPEQRAQADSVLRAVGSTLWLAREELLDAVTAVSGSGPAYVFYFIEAMQEAAQKMGLTPEQGTRLALATFSGAAELAATSSDTVDVLRAKVTSKGGTTFAALSSM
ncbi:MAG: pyrroline-5-carboxylate reductase, partial [Burkholderiales bacterium]|nr:pyrroline-5-carboxylate reductase [Burkholderiales bacterium]